MVVDYIDSHQRPHRRGRKLGVEPICEVLRDARVQIAPSYATKQHTPRAAAATARRYGVPPGLAPSRATVLDDIDRLEGTGPPRGRGMDRERLTQAAIATKIIPAAGGAPPKNAVVKSPAPDVQARDIGVGRASSPDIRPLRSGLPRGRELEGAVPVEPAAVPCRAPVLLAHWATFSVSALLDRALMHLRCHQTIALLARRN